MLDRTLTSALARAMRTFPAVVLTGARQTGKTTLLRSLHTHRYVSLEDPDVRARAVADPRGFLDEHPPPVIFDEIQHVPELFSYLKTRIDADRRPGAWLLSGSQAFGLMAGVTESLAGRAAILQLHPMSVAEALGRPGGDLPLDALIAHTFSPAAPSEAPAPAPPLDDWLLRGAFPEPRTNPAVDRRMWCASYVQSYLQRDVRDLAAVGDLRTFDVFLRLCAARTAQLLNLADLARDAGVSATTARRWLAVLEASGIVFLLSPAHNNLAKRLVKSPKLYFIDTAMVTFLTGLHTPEPTLHGPTAGALFETVMVAEWVKAFVHRGEPPALSFFRTADGLEVDLLVEHDGEVYPCEMKLSATITPHHAAALQRFRQLSGVTAPGVLFATTATSHAVAPHIVARPWWWLATA
jgi:predicted AAA+ superfamily ATPase